jgi:hypothetical protein
MAQPVPLPARFVGIGDQPDVGRPDLSSIVGD